MSLEINRDRTRGGFKRFFFSLEFIPVLNN